ncbi:MAG TPA: hypothetical protein VD816_07525 [Ohtaekwangia sp.]|nr:hypothetical protein [Ohtaekwangia sp.]
MKRLTFLLLPTLILASCSDRIIYYGRSYPQTTNVDLYFRESDVNEPHEIMGKATLEVSARKNSDKVQAKLLDRAKRKGADALIFDDIALTNTGSRTGGAVAGARAKRGFLGIFGSRTRFSKGQQVKATLLKYKKNTE